MLWGKNGVIGKAMKRFHRQELQMSSINNVKHFRILSDVNILTALEKVLNISIKILTFFKRHIH